MKKRVTLIINSVLLTLVSLCFSSVGMAEGGELTTLRVGINPYYKPLAYKQDGELTGIEPATALAVGKQLSRDIQFVELAWDDLLPALQKGDIDVIMSGMSVTEERKKRVDFSTTYLDIGQMAIIRISDAGSLSYPGALYKQGRTVGVEPNTTGESYAREFLTTAIIKTYITPSLAFTALRNGDINYYIHDAPTSWELAQTQEYNDLLPLYRSLSNESLAWAVKKGNSALLADLNRALATLTSNGTVNAIQNRWIPVKVAVSH